MADQKISELPVTSSVAEDDLFVVVDTSATQTKQITSLNLFENISSNVSVTGYLTSTQDITANNLISANGNFSENLVVTKNITAVQNITANNLIGNGALLTSLDPENLSTFVQIHYGGTNSVTTPELGGIAYGDGRKYQFSAAGTIGEVLVSAGVASPIWQNPNELDSKNANTADYLDINPSPSGLNPGIYHVTFSSNTTSDPNEKVYRDTKLLYNANTQTLQANNLSVVGLEITGNTAGAYSYLKVAGPTTITSNNAVTEFGANPKGTIAWDENWLYLAVSNDNSGANTVKRVALSVFGGPSNPL